MYLYYAKKIILIFIVIAILVAIIAGIYFAYDSVPYYKDLQEFIENDLSGEKITLVSQDTDEYGIGTYIFSLDKIPEIQIHAFKRYSTFDSDAVDRIYKYLFENWDNQEKEKFVVSENYIDQEFPDKTVKNWRLEYSTCISVTNYSELMDALNLILEFEKYKSELLNWDIIVNSSIEFRGEYIIPHNSTPNQSEEEIINQVQEWYVNTAFEKNSNYDDIPNDVLEKYTN